MKEGTNESLSRANEPNRTVKLDGPPPATPATDERQIDDLIDALGTPKHRAHRTAVDELVALGPAAVPALTNALSPNRPWLTAYRSAEALAQIGDGRATGGLINALRHPNSNVRWSVVQALSEIGDSRSLLALRRVAREDRGKTSWGEAVSDTAQLALDRLQGRSIFLRLWDPLKTIVFAAAMIAAVVWAANRVQELQAEISTPVLPPLVLTPEEQTATAEAIAQAQAEADATPAPTPEPTPAPSPTTASANVTGQVISSANVRSGPAIADNVVGNVPGGTVEITGRNGEWYRVRVPNGPEGWMAQSLITVPAGSNIPEVQP